MGFGPLIRNDDAGFGWSWLNASKVELTDDLLEIF